MLNLRVLVFEISGKFKVDARIAGPNRITWSRSRINNIPELTMSLAQVLVVTTPAVNKTSQQLECTHYRSTIIA